MESATDPHSHLNTRQGARSGVHFSNRRNYDTNEKSVHQRATGGQEDGFDTPHTTACLCTAQRREGSELGG